MGENLLRSTMSRSLCAIVAIALCSAYVNAEVYLEEDFSGDWESRWTQSGAKEGLGAMKVSAGKFFTEGGEEAAKGLQTSQDAKFYAISTPVKEFSNDGKTMVVQFSVKHEQDIDCGGAYVKIGAFDQAKFEGSSEYNIMFGPDICGSSTKKTHVIFNYKGKNLDKKKEVRCESDTLSHLYTLIVKPDNTYEVQIDTNKVDSGSLSDGWDFLEPKQIRDPEDKKPEGYDDIPAKINDPKATKPDDWDDESDGEWEAPQIDNPDYKGAWKAKRISNPAYKGVWAPKKIANPKYVDDQTIGQYASFAWVGIDVWQVKAGTIFDNLLLTDDVETAKAAADKIKVSMAAEKKMKEEKDAEKAKKAEEERAKAEEERKAKEEEEKAKKPEETKDEKKEEDKKEEGKKEEL